jgi:hypothetical protein
VDSETDLPEGRNDETTTPLGQGNRMTDDCDIVNVNGTGQFTRVEAVGLTEVRF